MNLLNEIEYSLLRRAVSERIAALREADSRVYSQDLIDHYYELERKLSLMRDGGVTSLDGPHEMHAREAIVLLRNYQMTLSEDDRKDLWQRLYQGYCPICGTGTKMPCTCTKDE